MTTTHASSLRMDADHRYWLNDRELISVTTALKEAGMVDTAWFSLDAAERGTYVHQACDLLDDDNLGSYLPTVNGYVDAYRQFQQDLNPAWMQRERAVCDAVLGYAGTLDRAGYLRGRWSLLDIKTGPPAPWHGLQLAAYARLALSPDGLKPDRFDLYLTKHGTYRLVKQDARTDEGEFLAALTVAKYRRRHGLCD